MEKKKKKKILIISLAIVIIISIIFIADGLRKTPGKTVVNYYSAINKNQPRKVMKYLDIDKDSSYYESLFESFIKDFEKIKEEEDEKDEEIKAVIIDTDDSALTSETASVSYFVITEDSKYIRIDYEFDVLEKIDGRWLMDAY